MTENVPKETGFTKCMSWSKWTHEGKVPGLNKASTWREVFPYWNDWQKCQPQPFNDPGFSFLLGGFIKKKLKIKQWRAIWERPLADSLDLCSPSFSSKFLNRSSIQTTRNEGSCCKPVGPVPLSYPLSNLSVAVATEPHTGLLNCFLLYAIFIFLLFFFNWSKNLYHLKSSFNNHFKVYNSRVFLFVFLVYSQCCTIIITI